MDSVRAAWTDERLDDLKGEVGLLRTEMNARLDGVQRTLDGIQRTMIYGAITLSTATLAGFVALATQL
jgi:hypothetical protein